MYDCMYDCMYVRDDDDDSTRQRFDNVKSRWRKQASRGKCGSKDLERPTKTKHNKHKSGVNFWMLRLQPKQPEETFHSRAFGMSFPETPSVRRGFGFSDSDVVLVRGKKKITGAGRASTNHIQGRPRLLQVGTRPFEESN